MDIMGRAAARSQAAPRARDVSIPARRSDPLWYFHSGQYRADARTLAGAIRYVLEPTCDSDGASFPTQPTNRPGEIRPERPYGLNTTSPARVAPKGY
jgi:hypothetical protein